MEDVRCNRFLEDVRAVEVMSAKSLRKRPVLLDTCIRRGCNSLWVVYQ